MKSGYTLLNGYTDNAYGGNYSVPEAPSTLGNGLIHYYTLDEPTGSFIDSVGSKNLTRSGSGVTSVAGKHGNAARFTTSSGNAFNVTGYALGQTTDGVCWAWWAYRDTQPVTNVASMLAYPSTTNTVWDFSMTTSANRLGGNVKCAVNPSVSVAPSVAPGLYGAWHLFVVNWNENHDKKLHMYCISLGTSGVSAGTGGSELLFNGTAGFAIARGGVTGTQPFGVTGVVAMIDEVGVWNRWLTLAERNDLYHAGAGKFYPF